MMTHEDFGYMSQDDFDRILQDEKCVNFLIERSRNDLEKATEKVMATTRTLVELDEFNEKSAFALAVTTVLIEQVDRVAYHGKKIGFLSAFV